MLASHRIIINSFSGRGVTKQVVARRSLASMPAGTRHLSTDSTQERSWVLEGSSKSTWANTVSSLIPGIRQNGNNAAEKHLDLPRTFDQAMRYEGAALVVTTAKAPHTIVHVNKAWQNLCGFTREEALDKTIDELIQGPESNRELANATVDRLSKTNKPQDVYLVNYKKSGETFKNHLTVGPLFFDLHSNEDPGLFVGILDPVAEVPLRMAASASP